MTDQTEMPIFVGVDVGNVETSILCRRHPDGTIEIIDEYTIINAEQLPDGSWEVRKANGSNHRP